MKTNAIFDILKDTASITNVGLVRKENEDNLGYADTQNGHVFVVCDGMGGHVGGKEASAIAVTSIIEYLNGPKKPDITLAMSEAIRFANKNIYVKAKETPALKGMGTTVVLLVVQDDKIYIGHVGDSRIYLFSDNQLLRLTKDHSYIQELFDRGIITNDEMKHHSRKNEITKALGLKPDVEPEIANEPLLLKNDDTLLLCSDGLSDMVEDVDIRDVIRNNPDVKTSSKTLLNMALSAGGKDNITIQMIKITNSNYMNSIFVNKSNVILPETDNGSNELDTLIDKDYSDNFNNKFDRKKINFKDPKIISIIIAVILLLVAIVWFALHSFSVSEKKGYIYKIIKGVEKQEILKNKKEYVFKIKNTYIIGDSINKQNFNKDIDNIEVYKIYEKMNMNEFKNFEKDTTKIKEKVNDTILLLNNNKSKKKSKDKKHLTNKSKVKQKDSTKTRANGSQNR